MGKILQILVWEYKKFSSVSTSLCHSLYRNILEENSVNGNILQFVHFGFTLKDNADIKLYLYEVLVTHKSTSWGSDCYHMTFVFKMEGLKYIWQPTSKLFGNEEVALKELIKNFFVIWFREVWRQNSNWRYRYTLLRPCIKSHVCL